MSMKMQPRSVPSTMSRRRSGFTLVEVMVAAAIASLLMMGTMNLYIGSLQMASRTQAEVVSSEGAALAVHHITDITREASWFSLPDSNDNGYFSANLTTANMSQWSSNPQSNFISTSGGNFADTSIFIAYPATANTVSVVDTMGATRSLTSLYNRTAAPSQYLLIYRSDVSGNPAPTNGTYLWESGTDYGNIVNKALISGIDPSWDAVQFVRPRANDGTVVHYEVEIKITCSQYSAINGQQTNEATNGTNTTQLIGKCVAIRNHESTLLHEPNNVVTSQTGNRFRFS